MYDNYFTWNGRRCLDLGVVVEYFPDQPKPARRVETVTIPGRSGALRLTADGFENVKVKYRCWYKGSPERASEVADWLFASGEYGELRDTYHPGRYRMAAFDGPLDIANIFNEFGRADLTFTAQPQLWADSGKNTVQILPSGEERVYQGTLFNPYPFEARPLIRLVGTGAATLSVGVAGSADKYGAFSVEGVEEYIDIDCETLNAYKGDQNCNRDLKGWTKFLRLWPGENLITIAGVLTQTITAVQITPRWWGL